GRHGPVHGLSGIHARPDAIPRSDKRLGRSRKDVEGRRRGEASGLPRFSSTVLLDGSPRRFTVSAAPFPSSAALRAGGEPPPPPRVETRARSGARPCPPAPSPAPPRREPPARPAWRCSAPARAG